MNVDWSPQTSPDTFDFGTVDIGQTPGQTFHLTNTGSVRTPALRIKLTGSSVFKKMRDTCAGTRLAPGKSCLVRVQYTPATDGQTDSTVMTANNKTLTATYASITITGTAHGTADLVWTDTATGQPIASYDFGSTAGSHQFTLTNVGTAPAYLTSIQFSGSGGQGLSNDGGCGKPLVAAAASGNPLPVGWSCTETVTFSPICGDGPTSWGINVGYVTDSTFTTREEADVGVTAENPPCT